MGYIKYRYLACTFVPKTDLEKSVGVSIVEYGTEAPVTS